MKASWLEPSRYTRSADWIQGKSWHDSIWLMVPILAILLTGPAWFFRLVDVQMGPLTWSLFVFVLIRELMNSWAARLKNNSRILGLTLAGDVVGVCLLGLLWHFSQTVSNPLFLLVLLVPIIAGALVYASPVTFGFAALSIATVALVAWIDVPQVRNALLQTSLIPGWLAAYISLGDGGAPGHALGDYSAATAISALLAITFGCILTAAIADRLCGQFVATVQRTSKELAAVSEEGRPTFFVNRDTLSIESGNKAFQDYCVIGTADVGTPAITSGSDPLAAQAAPAQSLFECIQFDEEKEMRRIIEGRGGATICHYRVGLDARVGLVHVRLVPNGNQCQIVLEDLTAECFLRATLESLDQGVILLAENRAVLYFNAAAKLLFPWLVNGVEAATALHVEALGSPWWELGERSRHNRTLSINGRNYHTTCVAARLSRQELPMLVISLSEA